MKDGEIVGEFQEAVEGVLIRHRSILDCLSKFHESTSRTNRAITKTVTNCGCISINAIKQQFPQKDSLKDCSKYMDSQIKGALCDHCREVIAEELGNHFFYLAALCSLLDYRLEDIITLEQDRINTLGHFLLS